MKTFKILLIAIVGMSMVACTSPERMATKLVSQYAERLVGSQDFTDMSEFKEAEASALDFLNAGKSDIEHKFINKIEQTARFHSALDDALATNDSLASYNASKLKFITSIVTPDLLIFDLRGPVKEVQYYDDRSSAVYSFSFDENGVLVDGEVKESDGSDYKLYGVDYYGSNKMRLKRDEDGKITSLGVYQIAWDNDRPITFSYDWGTTLYSYSQVYDSDGVISKVDYREHYYDGFSDIKKSTDLEYTDDEFYNHITSSGETGCWNFGHKRNITYWN